MGWETWEEVLLKTFFPVLTVPTLLWNLKENEIIVQLRKMTDWAWRKSTECPEYIAWLPLEHGRNVEAPHSDIILNCTMCVTLQKGKKKSQLCQFTRQHCHLYVCKKELTLAALHWHWSEIFFKKGLLKKKNQNQNKRAFIYIMWIQFSLKYLTRTGGK